MLMHTSLLKFRSGFFNHSACMSLPKTCHITDQSFKLPYYGCPVQASEKVEHGLKESCHRILLKTSL